MLMYATMVSLKMLTMPRAPLARQTPKHAAVILLPLDALMDMVYQVIIVSRVLSLAVSNVVQMQPSVHDVLTGSIRIATVVLRVRVIAIFARVPPCVIIVNLVLLDQPVQQ